MNISIINGPNLNLLGSRESDIYGNISFEQYLENLRQINPRITIEYYQSNIEGEIIDQIQKSALISNGIILNAAAYTHTSIGIGDAVKAISIPVIEVHISNIYAREAFRHHSYISPNASGIIVGFGLHGYQLAVEYLTKIRN